MSKRKNSGKISLGNKVSIGALSVLGIIGGWHIIGRLEQRAAVEEPIRVEPLLQTPLATAVPTAWPTIPPLAEMPRLVIEPLPTPASGLMASELETATSVTGEATGAFELATLPQVAPLPTLAPLPAMPEYVPPPPPPRTIASTSGGGSGSGGNTSKGS